MLSLIFNSVIPVFGIILIGVFAGKTKILGDNGDRIITRFVYYFALPILFFVSTATENIHEILNINFILAFTVIMLIFYGIGIVYGLIFNPKNWEKSSLIALAVSCPNAAFMGIPILVAIVGKKGVLPAALASIITVLTLAITVIVLEFNQSNNANKQKAVLIKKSLYKVCCNPLIISTALGIIYSTTGMSIYPPIKKIFFDLGSTVGPCALFALGLSLYGKKLSLKHLSEVGVISFLKLIVQPLIALPILYFFHVSPLWAAAALIMCSLPTGAFLYILAQEYDCNFLENSIAIVIGTTILSIFTLIGSLYLVGYIWPTVIV